MAGIVNSAVVVPALITKTLLLLVTYLMSLPKLLSDDQSGRKEELHYFN